MTRFVTAIAVAVTFLVGGATTTWAADTVTTVASALQSKPVYVAPNVPGIPSDAASTLQQQLNDGDNIVLVILPASALDQTGGDIQAFASQLDKATGHKRIIGIAAGDQYAGYSSLLPEGVATERMTRATSLSRDTVERLEVFARNVHDWQSLHPQARASQPQKSKPQSSDPPTFGIIVATVIFGVAAFLVARYFFVRSTSATEGRVKFRASPDPVRDKLRKILELHSQVRDSTLQGLLTQVCRDSEAYFARAQRRGDDLDLDAETFKQHLSSVVDVVERYIDIQTNPRYYAPTEEAAQELMHKGYQAVEGFGQFVLSSIQRGGRRGLMDYNVNIDILDASRWR